MNFGLAAEMARSEGIPVEMIVVDDDVALDGEVGITGARGLAGTVFVHKLVGAAAAEGKTLAEVAATGRAAIDALATMGVSFSAGTSPSVGKPSFELGGDEMELGLGIHGEPGVKRTHIMPANELVEVLLTRILQHDKFGSNRRLAVMLNNLGATTEMELAVVARHVMAFLQEQGFTVERIFAGTFLSSLDMAGISITVLAVDDESLRLLDAPTMAAAWPNGPNRRPGKVDEHIGVHANIHPAPVVQTAAQTEIGRSTRRAIVAACDALIGAEGELTEMDRVTGDGDLGTSMKRAALAIRSAVDSYPVDNIPATLKALGHCLRHELGGSSGPLYGVLFLRCGNILEHYGELRLTDWAAAVEEACRAITELGGAKTGDRTMLDALDAFARALNKHRSNSSVEVLRTAIDEAERAADATAQMMPRMGRSVYLGNRVLGHPDPGAKAVTIWLNGAAGALFPERSLGDTELPDPQQVLTR